VAGPNAPLLAADSARLLAELLPEETAAELFSARAAGAGDGARHGHGYRDDRDASARSPTLDASSFLVTAFESVGTAAALARREPGFAEIGAVAPTAVSRGAAEARFGFGGDAGDSYAYAWAGSGASTHRHGSAGASGLKDGGSGSPRRGFASAQRTALEVLATLARVSRVAVSKNDAAALERTLAALARGEPNPSIAAAAGAAAQSVKGLML
jgi:hypothetical protein